MAGGEERDHWTNRRRVCPTVTDETEARDREGPIDRMDGWRVSLRSGDVKRERQRETNEDLTGWSDGGLVGASKNKSWRER